MLRTKRIKDLDQIQTQAFSPPPALLGSVEDAEVRGEAWWVVMAFSDSTGDARWVVVFPDTQQALFFTEGDQLNGRWDQEHELFFPEEGPPLNLLGNPVSLSSVEEDEEEEDGWRDSE